MSPVLIALLCGLAPVAAIACACAITSAEVQPDPTPCIHPDDQGRHPAQGQASGPRGQRGAGRVLPEGSMNTLTKVGAIAGYDTAVVAANWLTNRYGFVPVGFGLMAAAGTYAAGVALLARDVVQDTSGRLAVLLAIATGALLSAWLSTPQLALASGVAFLLAETADMAVYTPLRERGWARAVLISNLIGGVLDTLVFLWLAGFPLTAASIGGQLVGKLLWATAVPVVLVLAIQAVRRAVSRHPVRA